MSLRTTRLVVEREIREAARRKGIWALVALVFLGATAMVTLPDLISGDESATVALVGDDDLGLDTALGAVPDRDIELTPAADRGAARLEVEEGRADLAILLGNPPVLLVEDEQSTLVAIVREVVANRAAAARLADAGIDPDAVAAAFLDAAPEVEPIDVERRSREGAALAIGMVLYILTVVLTGQVATGVAIEKSNRVSEVLLAIVPPRSMLFGKVIGVGCIGLGTLLAGAIPVGVKLATGGDLPANLGPSILASSAWFVGGLALYLTLGGALGALVSRQEEAGAVVTPLTMLLVVGYFATLVAGDSALGTALAYVPLVSPMVEPYRIAVGLGSPLEYALSLALLAAAVVAVSRVATVVFRRAIVRTGHRLKLRDVLRGPSH